MSYTTLVAAKTTPGSIAYWANHASVDSTGILAAAEAWIFERLRAREMRKSTTVALALNAYYAALPSAFLEPVELKWRGDSEPMDYVHESLLGRYIAQGDTAPQQGRPSRFAIFDERFEFEVACSETSGLTADLIYYQRPDALALTSNETNFLTSRFPLLLQRICTALAYEDRKRDATAQYLLAEQSIMEANVSEDLGRRGQVLR